MATAFSEDYDRFGTEDGSAAHRAGPVAIVPPDVDVRPDLDVQPGLDVRPDLDVRPNLDGDCMSPAHESYFRAKLIAWRESIVAESRSTLDQLQADCLREPDATDRASSETDWGLELRTRDRQRKLIAKINAALRRIDAREYGYCEVTGEPIALARLEARPIATMTVEAQTKHEAREKISRDD